MGLWETSKSKLRPYPVAQAHYKPIRKEIEPFCKIGVLRKSLPSKSASPSFAIPKKNKRIRVVSDFRKLNKSIQRKPFPIPRIQETLLNVGGYTYVTSLDPNMGYYIIRLCPHARKLCQIVFPSAAGVIHWLPMGVVGASDIFQ